MIDKESAERWRRYRGKARGYGLCRRGRWGWGDTVERETWADGNHRLINEASIKSKQRGERALSARSVKRVSEDVLRKYKG